MKATLVQVAQNRDQAELSELLGLLADAIKLAVDRGFTLLGFLFGIWLDGTRFSLPLTKPEKEIERLMTVAEAATYLNVKPRTIHGWIQQGLLKPRYVGTDPRFKLAELDQWTLTKHSQN